MLMITQGNECGRSSDPYQKELCVAMGLQVGRICDLRRQLLHCLPSCLCRKPCVCDLHPKVSVAADSLPHRTMLTEPS